MYIENITLKGYRNYINKNIEFSKGVNIFKGENAQGKTNLLEAIYFLSCGKSFRTQKDTDLIHFDQEKAYIKANYLNRSGHGEIEALLLKEEKKRLKINAQPIKKLTELFGQILTVAFSPDELKILKESPSLRRKFIDMEITKVRPAYLFDLQSYEKAMNSKNALLKSKMKEEQIKKLVSVFNIQLAEFGELIIKRRMGYIKVLNEQAKIMHRKLTGQKENLDILYQPCVKGENIKNLLYEKLESSIKQELEYGYTVVGPHREDIVFHVDQKDAKLFASQGQQRTTMLSVKLATANIIKEVLNEEPVILLDDVLSELDKQRQLALLKILNNMQIMITTASEIPNEIKDLSVTQYLIKNGDVKLI